MKNGLVVDEYGNKIWYKNNLFHREDGPAIIYTDGNKYWFIEGKPHRLCGPAFEHPNCIKYWYIEGVRIKVKSNEEVLRLVKLMSFI